MFTGKKLRIDQLRDVFVQQSTALNLQLKCLTIPELAWSS